ncbi:MAG: ABC transporter ATP-binding protein [Lachnospiraceae bacterium]|nr:ABC transporter ATP-binding protein [Lachnospiraceae bacterium]
MEENKDIMLSVRDLAISFYGKTGEVQAVRGISYDLKKGEVLGIVGESGSGKSVSTHGILRLTPDTGKIKSGEILFEGRDILKMNKKELQSLRGNRISMIFQDPMTALDPLFTVGYQLNESLKKHTDLNKEERHKRMLELLPLVGINEPERRLKQYPHELSGGMRQRIMIAIALSCNPALLIADEPTTALDVTIQAQIIDLLKDLKEKLGMAIIFITHDLGVVSDICDRIIVMYAGKIVEEGSSREIFYSHRHPYTQGLLDSVPDISTDQDQRLKPIPGNPPIMTQVRPGCAFAERCSCAMGICVKQDPPLFDLGGTHTAACWKLLQENSNAVPDTV